jgi:hypothetical protein
MAISCHMPILTNLEMFRPEELLLEESPERHEGSGLYDKGYPGTPYSFTRPFDALQAGLPRNGLMAVSGVARPQSRQPTCGRLLPPWTGSETGLYTLYSVRDC